MDLKPSLDVKERHRWKLPRRAKYPIWSPGSLLLLGLIVIGLTAGLVFGIGRKAVFVEAEIAAGIVALCVFVFLFVGLYRGVRVRKQARPSFEFKPIRDIDSSGFDVNLPDLNGFDCPVDGGDDGCISGILTLIFSLFILVLLVGLLWILVNVLWVVVPVIATAVYWVFYSALRVVFAKSKKCRGNLQNSLGYAVAFTFLYTGWFLALLMLAAHLVR